MPSRVTVRAPKDISINTISFATSSSCHQSVSPTDPSRSLSPIGNPKSESLAKKQSRTSLLARKTTRFLLKALSTQDLAASSRLTGYLSIFTAYLVLLVSALQYKYSSIRCSQTDDEYTPPWKLKGAIIGSSVLVGLMVLIILAHLDTVFFPNIWRQIFSNGSVGECVILSFVLLCSIFILFVSTSNSGVAGLVGLNSNVYFTSWIGFYFAILTLKLWFHDKGMLFLGEIIRKSSRRTNYYWSWTLFFSIVTLLSLIETFLDIGGKESFTERSQLVIIFCATASVASCIFALILNYLLCPPKQSTSSTTTSIPTTPTSTATTTNQKITKCQSLWYKFELVMIIALGGFWTWVVFRFTGINGLVNGPTNKYFGAWGSFFFAISTLGCWLKEHKDVTF